MSTFPVSCDTFVALPPSTRDGCIIFGKNSDRPRDEVQEIEYHPSRDHDLSHTPTVACTYISIPQVEHTHAVVLSKPVWMWGAEMGANELGVCVGNEAVWTRLHESQLPEERLATERLLGMDLVRLALERAATAREACDVISELLESHGQGGACSGPGCEPFFYHNSFLVADSHGDAWVLETAGRFWVAERVSSCRNISNCLSIDTGYQRHQARMMVEARARGLWNGQGKLDFAAVFGPKPANELINTVVDTVPGAIPGSGTGTAASLAGAKRLLAGRSLLETAYSQVNKFSADDMMKILRHHPSNICRAADSAFPTASSQVSILFPANSAHKCCHLFTGTVDTSVSVFKPFLFVDNVQFPSLIHCSSSVENSGRGADDTVDVNRNHLLSIHHKEFVQRCLSLDSGKIVSLRLAELEKKWLSEAIDLIAEDSVKPDKTGPGSGDIQYRIQTLFKRCVEAEFSLYQSCSIK